MFYIRSALLAIVIAGFFSCPKAHSQGSGIPTFDAASYIQNVEELARIQDLITKAEQEIQMLDRQLNALTGSRGMGNLLSGMEQQDIRRYAPQNWQQTLDILNAGGNPGSLSDLKSLYKQKSQLFGHARAEEINPESPEELAAFSYARDIALGSMALSELSFNRNDRRIANYEQLLTQIDKAADTKASADLSNRIAIENGLSSSELIRLQATQIQLDSARANQNLKYESDIYKFSSGEPHITLSPINP